MKKKSIPALILSLITIFSLTATSMDKPNIKNFSKVATFLYRGAQPDKEGFKELKKMGFERVINFRNEKKLIEKERRIVTSLGMEYISIPWVIYGKYNSKIFDSFFEAIKDKKKTFFHCKRGVERTGVMAAAYKIKYQNYNTKEAIEYAKQFGVKKIWLFWVKDKIKKFASEAIR